MDCKFNFNCNNFKTCIPCKEKCPRKDKLSILFKNSNLPACGYERVKFQFENDTVKQEFVNINSQINKKIVSFVDSGKNALIHSHNTGCGKTAWAIRILQDYFFKCWAKLPAASKVSGMFISQADFFDTLKSAIGNPDIDINELKHNLIEADIVVWDDIGSKPPSDFEREQLYDIIDKRLNNHKSNIYTTNLNRDELKTYMGDRLYSRIYEFSTIYEFSGVSKRGVFKP